MFLNLFRSLCSIRHSILGICNYSKREKIYVCVPSTTIKSTEFHHLQFCSVVWQQVLLPLLRMAEVDIHEGEHIFRHQHQPKRNSINQLIVINPQFNPLTGNAPGPTLP